MRVSDPVETETETETEVAETVSADIEDRAEIRDDSATSSPADEAPGEPTASADVVADVARGSGNGVRRVLSSLRPSRPRFAAALVVILVTGTAAIWSHSRTQAIRAAPAARNAALTDVATTSALKAQVTQSVQTLFSFDFSDPSKTDNAVPAILTGPALNQYATFMAPIRTHAAALKLVLTTTVTATGVQMLQGDRARVLVFADQTDTSTATAGTSESVAAFTIDAVRAGGVWRIAGIDAVS